MPLHWICFYIAYEEGLQIIESLLYRIVGVGQELLGMHWILLNLPMGKETIGESMYVFMCIAIA